MKRFIALLLLLMGLAVGICQIPAARGQEKKPPTLDPDVKALVEGNTEFAFDLYKKLAEKEEGNIVFSPYSISTALAMTYGGAGGETAKQMAKAMHFTLPPQQFHAAFGKLTSDLHQGNKDRPFELLVANALWGQKGYPFLSEFLKLTQKNYHAKLETLDFARDLARARETINAWVAAQTKDKITNLLPAGSLKETTRLVVTNAIYLKGTWEEPFNKELTKTAPFEVSETQQVSVPIMLRPFIKEKASKKFNYGEGDGFQWLELPYKGNRLSMVLLLPQKRGGLTEAEKMLTATVVHKGIAGLEPRTGSIGLPRFKFALGVKLLGRLKAMGLPQGPLTNMTSAEPLCIADVFHQAYIDVDEVGTEAAAATAVDIRGISKQPPPFRFYADHPFLFLIRDTQTGSILFVGRVTNPA